MTNRNIIAVCALALVLGCNDEGGNHDIPPCGNGRLDPGELCDSAIAAGVGICPTSCNADDPCMPVNLTGSASACNAGCVPATPITACSSGDGCCPTACSALTDRDCPIPADTVAGTLVAHVKHGATEELFPRDLRTATIQALVPTTSGFDVVQGSGNADGTFTITGVPESVHYYLRYSNHYIVTSGRFVALDYFTAQRPSRRLAQSEATELALTVRNLAPWQDSDRLELVSTRAGAFFLDLQAATTNPPALNDTALAGMVVRYLDAVDPALIDTAQGDEALLLQLSHATSGAFVYSVLTRSLRPSTLTQKNGERHTIDGDFATVPADENVSFAWRRSAFDALDGEVYPAGTLRWDSGFFVLFACPFALDRGLISSCPDLIIGEWPAYQAADSALALGYGMPFGDGWHIGASFEHWFAVEIQHPAATGPSRWFKAGVELMLPLAELAGATVAPRLSLPLAPKVDGHDALPGVSHVGTSPVVSWDAPTLGTPDYYLLRIYRIFVDTDGSTGATWMGSLFTKQASVRLPPGILTTGSHYVFRITAAIDGIDVETAPYQATSLGTYASTVTGLISP